MRIRVAAPANTAQPTTAANCRRGTSSFCLFHATMGGRSRSNRKKLEIIVAKQATMVADVDVASSCMSCVNLCFTHVPVCVFGTAILRGAQSIVLLPRWEAKKYIYLVIFSFPTGLAHPKKSIACHAATVQF